MKVILSGAERGASRNLLLDSNVERMGVNISQLHIPQVKTLDLRDRFKDAELWIYTSDGDENIERYSSFIEEYHTDLHSVIGRSDYDGKWLGDKYVPLWNDREDLERLAHLCETYNRVAVSDKALDKVAISRIQQLRNRWKTEFFCITSKVKFITAFDWDGVLVAHWTSVMKFGETQVWDGKTLRRYSKEQRVSARNTHKADIERLLAGSDYTWDDVTEENANALAVVAIRSWLELEMAANGAYRVDEGPNDSALEAPEDPSEAADSNYTPLSEGGPNSGTGLPVLTNTPAQKRHDDDKALLPFLALEGRRPTASERDETPTEEGSEPRQVSVHVTRARGNLRQCDSCYLSARCPEYRGGFECAYEFPVKLETVEQLKSMLNLIMEQQFERAMFALFGEQTEGQGVDPVVSKEFDRVFTMAEKIREFNDDRDVFSLKVEARQQGAGVLNRIFGSKAVEQMNPLPQAIDTNRVVQELGVVDAEVVDETSGE